MRRDSRELRVFRISCSRQFLLLTICVTTMWTILFSYMQPAPESALLLSARENNYTIYNKNDKVHITEMLQILDREDFRGRKGCIQNKPDIVMIGVPKCGTGSVRTFLSEHPDIAMEMNSEGVQYFNLRYMRDWIWYISQMPCSKPGQLTAENSPQYFTSEEAPLRMYEFNPNMKLIVTVRDPIKRLASEFVQMALGRPQFLTGETVEENVIDPETDEIRKKKTLVSKSIYVRYLKKWISYFGVNQIHVVDGDEFAKNPVKELNDIERFLGIRKYFTKDHFAYVESRGFFCMTRKDGVQCLEKGKGRPHPYIPPLVLRRLKEFYAPYNEELFLTIGKRFNWT